MKSFLVFICVITFSLSSVSLNLPAKDSAKTAPSAIRLTPPAPKFSDVERQAELAKRRAGVAKAMSKNSIMILYSSEPKIYTNDVDFLYRQENNLYYLTNLKQDNATLVLINDGGANVKEILFLPRRDPSRETWNGKMYSSENAASISGVKTVLDANELNGFIQSVKDKKSFASKDGAFSNQAVAETVYLLLPSRETDSNGMREFRRESELSKTISGYKIENAKPIFTALRLTKSPTEIKFLQHAIDITTEAVMRSMAMANRANWEYEIQAEVEYTFRRRNADYWGYPSIVGCGPNATTLHYEEAQSAVKQGDLVLMDVGAEYEHYTADVTRTYPTNGKFSKEQAEIYQIVYDAQEAAAKTLKPGAKFSEPSQAASKTIEEGLAKLGLITAVGAFVPGTEREITDAAGTKRKVGTPQSRIWYMHGWGHWLGMNVHDVGGGGGTVLQPGMTFTNEPGIYVREDALDYLPDTPETKAFVAKIKPAFEKYKNIGVRIEDDMLITDSGVEWMTKNLPRKMNEIEALIAKASKEMLSSSLPKETNRTFAVLDDYNLFDGEDINWNPFAPKEFMNGKTVRRGWISIGKSVASSGSQLHSEHLQGE